MVSIAMTGERFVDIRFEGVVEYQTALAQMKELQMLRIEDRIHDTLLLLEHPEIVTVGPRARNDGITPPPTYPAFPVDRGGGLTWHGPGQIVCYPIFKWDLPGEDSVTAIISKLEDWVIRTLADLGIPARKDGRMQGVWVGDNKVCSIGLSFLRWTSRHGLTININTPAGRVENLSGCGLGEATTTCLAKLGYDVDRDYLIESLLENMMLCLSRGKIIK
ncbi:MAG TPA: lipoyl(octanoyl) transferase [Candidatus Poseidoniales archaeon]|nr:MAG TPA: lipoyl(octanoyl) transferase [Candidatus Poseidoniales archaeon]